MELVDPSWLARKQVYAKKWSALSRIEGSGFGSLPGQDKDARDGLARVPFALGEIRKRVIVDSARSTFMREISYWMRAGDRAWR